MCNGRSIYRARVNVEFEWLRHNVRKVCASVNSSTCLSDCPFQLNEINKVSHGEDTEVIVAT